MPSIQRESLTILSFCLAVGGYVVLACGEFPVAHDAQGFGQGPGFYPSVLAWSLILLGVLNFLADWKASRPVPGHPAVKVESPPEDAPRLGLVAAVVGLAAADILIMQYLGFFAAGFILVWAMLLLIRPSTKPLVILSDAVYGAAMVALIYLVFEAAIKIQLPRGTLLG